MKVRISLLRIFGSVVVLGMIQIEGCSTGEVVPIALPTLPPLAEVPHPVGRDLTDLAAIFTADNAPHEVDFTLTCDVDFLRLKNATESPNELKEGTAELVRKDPVHYHWCFYGKLWDLEQNFKKKSYVDEKQKDLLKAYEFLTPVARAFYTEFKDSRYMQWATIRYQKASEFVFYRKLELTPQGTSELVEAANPFAGWRVPSRALSVLDKYHIIKPEPRPNTVPTIAFSPVALPEKKPEVKDLEVPTPSASVEPDAIPAVVVSPIPIPSEAPVVMPSSDGVVAPTSVPSVVPVSSPTPEPVSEATPVPVLTPTPVPSPDPSQAGA